MKAIVVGLLIVVISSLTFAQSNSDNVSIFSKKQKFDNEGVELYSSNTDMKSFKKLGLGLSVGGTSGLLGLNAEVNLDPNEALIIGLGAGPSYGTFAVGLKHNFDALYLSPYAKAGYSKWFSSSGKNATDSDVLKRIFSDEELRSGRFDADFFFGGMGLEYNQLEGELAGVNLFGEVILMDEISSSTFIPSGAIGVIDP